VNGDRLLFLLKHEFRLGHRSFQSLRSLLLPFSLVAVMEILGGFALWALNHFQLPQVSFSADYPPDNALWIAGGVICYFLYLALLCIFLAVRRTAVDQNAKNWLYSSPIPDKISFASAVLHQSLTASVGINITLSMFSVPLGVIYQSPRLWLGMHLTMTAWMMTWVSLEFWGLYAALKWSDRRLWKILKAIVLCGPAVLVLGFLFLPSSSDKNFLSREGVIQIITEQAKRGNLLGGDSWLWFPARAVFLDPLPSLIWIITGIGLTWLTIQALHRPLSRDLSATFNPPKPISSAQKTPRQFQDNLRHLLILRDWKRIPLFPSICFYSLCLISYSMCMSPSGLFQIDAAVGLALGSVLIPAFNTSLLTHYCIAEDPMQDVLRSSPISFTKAKAYKRLAGLIPIWVSILPILIGLSAFSKPWVLVAVFALAATTSHAYLRDWNSCPVKSTDVFNMNSDLDALGCRDRTLSCIEGLSFLVWLVIALGFLMNQMPMSIFFLSVEGYILFRAHRRNRLLGDSWSV
jgi:ABC-2 type transport system permease protein